MPVKHLKYLPGADFPIKAEVIKNVTIDKVVGGYDEYIIAFNGFIVAHFIDEASARSYMTFIQAHGIKYFPKFIIEVLRSMSDTNGIKHG